MLLRSVLPWFVLAFLLFHASDMYSQIRRLNDATVEVVTGTPAVDSMLAAILGAGLLSDAQALAHDSMEGRATGTVGYDRSAAYVRSVFLNSGWQGMCDAGYQRFSVSSREVRERIRIPSINTDSVVAKNIVMLKKGVTLPDEYVVLTAHLDHLGKNDDSVFHGANDNASGVAVMLALGRALADLPTDRSIVMIAFAAEEVGLKGSEYFVRHPPIDLDRIQWLLNLDLVGSGNEGLMVQGVDGFEAAFAELSMLNEQHFRFELKTRPNSPNSDQFHFHRMGVPAFFWYAYNGTSPYHHPGDTSDKLDPLILQNVARFALLSVLHFANR